MIISWNMELNCPLKRGDVRWVLRRFSCDIAILQKSNMGDIGHPIISIWGRCLVKWLFLLSGGRSGGIITIWYSQTFELLDLGIGSSSVYCKFKLLQDNFIWGLLGFMVLMTTERVLPFMRR